MTFSKRHAYRLSMCFLIMTSFQRAYPVYSNYDKVQSLSLEKDYSKKKI